MVEGLPNVEMRVFLRDQNPDLMDQYLNRGIFKSIPVFVFFDGDMKEVAPLHRAPAEDHGVHGAEAARAAAPDARRARRGVAAGRRRRDPVPARMNVAHLLEASARHLPTRTALVFGDRRWTYADLDREAGRVAAGLARLGVRAGQRVCLHLGNRPEFVFAYYGCQKLGATPVALNVTYVRDELAYIVRDSEAVGDPERRPVRRPASGAGGDPVGPGARGHRRAGIIAVRGARWPTRRRRPATAIARTWPRSSTPRPRPAGPRA